MRTLADGLREIAATPAHVTLSPTVEEVRRSMLTPEPHRINVEGMLLAIEQEKFLAALFGGYKCEKCNVCFFNETRRLIGCPSCVLSYCVQSEAEICGGE